MRSRDSIRLIAVVLACVLLGGAARVWAAPVAPAPEPMAQAKVEAQLCLAEARAFLDAENFLAAVERCDRVAALAQSIGGADLEDAAQQAVILKANAIRLARSTGPTGAAEPAKAPPYNPAAAVQAVLDQVDADAIPQTALLERPSYPSRTSDARSLPEAAEAQVLQLAPWEARIENALARRVQVEFRDTPLDQVVDFLREASGVNIVLDPDALGRSKPVTLKLGNPIRLRSALDWVMEITGLGYEIRDEAVFVSLPETVEGQPFTKAYEIADLLFNVGELPVVQLRGSKGLFEVENDPTQAMPPSSTEETGKAWAAWVTHTVEPGTWRDELGGRSANTISYRAGKLVVTHRPAVHQKIAELLARFRDARAAMVSIQTRFIQVSQNYLERIGFDWTGLTDVSSQVGVTTTVESPSITASTTTVPYVHIPAGFASDPDIVFIPGDPDNPGIAVTDTVAVTHRPVKAAVENVIGSLTLDTGATDTGGLFLRFSLLKGSQLSGLLDAVRKQGQGTVLNAPRVTCYNTQRANITIADLISYVQRVTSDNTPTIGQIVDGIIFEVQPFVSADRRYVTIELRPSINGLERNAQGEIDEFIYRTEGAGDAQVSSSVQVPRIARRGVNTTVSVPDGGTIMVGGFATASSTTSKATVPFLGQLPVVNFFFQREGTSDAKNSLLILLTANIILQED